MTGVARHFLKQPGLFSEAFLYRGRWRYAGKYSRLHFAVFFFRIRGLQASYRPVDSGSALQRFPDGSYLPCARTDARSLGIDKLLAKYRCSDREDARKFLEGFDAGEERILRTQGK